ncbi:hypothetical protein AERO_10415 [Aeromicrobium fastidiosum]|uniref:hypothetical protein n=1 Tax=Aeromicrobium fastidiosum TaxID=52699 RepID=UPI0020234B3F|nr:hypothetical protein [Aeromicrobium fastidiosum]MCL8251798.1 hypothetical protein [Aeromicrobium fastidiosum]
MSDSVEFLLYCIFFFCDSLVGSEMCIRDSGDDERPGRPRARRRPLRVLHL